MAKNIIGFSLSKTLINKVSWYGLNLALGITPEEDQVLYKLGPAGDGVLNYQEWVALLARIMVKRGRATRTRVDEFVAGITYVDGAKEVVEALKAHGFVVGAISGALSPIVNKVSHDLGLDFAYSNAQMVFDENNMLKTIELQSSDAQFKADTVHEVKTQFPDAGEMYYVGVGGNNQEIFRLTKGILIEPRNITDSKADGAWQIVQGLKAIPALFE